jgi:hypothetical protein
MGRTGMPVAIRLGLSFMETEYIVKGSPLLSNFETDAIDEAKAKLANEGRGGVHTSEFTGG